MAQGNPSWLVPVIEADGSALTVSIDPSAGVVSGIHTGYVSLRDADDPTVLVEVPVEMRAMVAPAASRSAIRTAVPSPYKASSLRATARPGVWGESTSSRSS